MKKFFLFVVALMVFASSAFALDLGPEKAVEALNNMVEADPLEDVVQLYAYNEAEDLVILGVVGGSIMDAAVAAHQAGKGTDDWTAYKASATQMYDTSRKLLDTYGAEETKMCVYFLTSTDSNGQVYYAIGDDSESGECEVLLDAITSDTEVTTYEGRETEDASKAE